MWKLIDIYGYERFAICYKCADYAKTKLMTFDTSKEPNKKEILKRAKIRFDKPSVQIPYGK